MSGTPGEASPLEVARAADRPRAHGGASETELAIFEAAERLLAEVPLHDLSVAQIIAAADVSRATFYFYFSSKYAVVTGLLARVMDEIYEMVQPFVQRQPDVAPEAALRESLEASAAVWSAHRAVLRATVEHWHAVPELRTRWLGVLRRFTEGVALEIDRERAEGLAPDGPSSRQLAAALMWGTERCLYVAGLGVDEDLPSEQDIVEPLLALWLGTIYGPWAGAPSRRKRTRTSPTKPTNARSGGKPATNNARSGDKKARAATTAGTSATKPVGRTDTRRKPA
jgi:AcrR family transcriptional regulator